MSLLLTMLACAATPLNISTEVTGCQAVETGGDWTESLSEPLVEDGQVQVVHNGITRACSSDGTLEVTSEGETLTVTESWSDATTSDCTTCFMATLTISDPPAGSYIVSWVVEPDGVFGEREFEVE